MMQGKKRFYKVNTIIIKTKQKLKQQEVTDILVINIRPLENNNIIMKKQYRKKIHY